MWEFFTEPEFQEKLDWMTAFVRDECEPLDLLFPRPGDPYDVRNKASRAILAPLREKVKEQGLWACHLGPELGGQGYGQLKLALMNEILGRGGRRRSSAPPPPTPATPRSSLCTERPSRRRATCIRCSREISCLPSR
jgi:alkylation response protein AidB-like acyl-CoA dehydrogenase